MLFLAKMTNRLGKVDDGTSILVDPEKLSAAYINLRLSIEWKNHKQCVDTQDISTSLEAIGPFVLWTVLCSWYVRLHSRVPKILNSFQAELPSMIFINKMERENANC